MPAALDVPPAPLGQLFTVTADGARPGGALPLCDCLVRPGLGGARHVQPRDDEEFYVLAGHATFRVGGRTVAAPAGTTVRVRRGTPHALRVDSDEITLVVLTTPAAAGA